MLSSRFLIRLTGVARVWGVFAALATVGCPPRARQSPTDAGPPLAADAGDVMEGALDASADGAMADAADGAVSATAEGPKLGIVGYQVLVFDKPQKSAKRLGYLRLGSIVLREIEPTSREGCKEGWYAIAPRGYVCAGEAATLDLDHPLLRVEGVRPDTSLPMPYAYGFMHYNAPLYLRIPNLTEQHHWEWGLTPHRQYYERHRAQLNKVSLGANDVLLDADGVALDDSPPTSRKLSTELSDGELFGGKTNEDPIPFWLEGGRKVPNIAQFKVTPKQYVAGKVARHAGIAFAGAFVSGAEAGGRKFAITTDLRLVPVDKVKPARGSPFHGVALKDKITLPLAWTRREGAHVYNVEPRVQRTGRDIPPRTLAKLTGKVKTIDNTIFREMDGGGWLKEQAMSLAIRPPEWPSAATMGEKWIDISIDNETLVLWEGKRPVYATLVSSGQDGAGDPKTTKSTVLGTFRIQSKHVTATMDSNGRSLEGGGQAPASSGEATPASSGDPDGQGASHGADGAFELRDVPYVEYFEAGFAIHAAYWHDAFGTPRSHGCVNVSPIDAFRIFKWTEPEVPQEWHAVVAGPEMGNGTVVNIRR